MLDYAAIVFAMAPAGADGQSGSLFAQFVPLILIFGIFWFLVIRPQQKKAKAHRELVENLKKGDEAYTDGGIHGVIQKVTDDYVTLEIAPKVAIKMIRSRIAEVVKTGKVEKADDSDKKETKSKKKGKGE